MWRPLDTEGRALVRSRSPRDFQTIQALRFVAALAVVALHSTFYVRERLVPGGPVFLPGGNGVQLFFVISGFVMIMSSQKLLGAPGGWHVFAFKRINRIVPLYWGVLCFKMLTLLASPGMALHTKTDWTYILKSFLFIPAMNSEGYIRPFLGVGWTLNYEMFFYVLFTIALIVRISPIMFIAPILVTLAGLSFLRTPDWPVPLYFLSDMIVLDFLTGMLIAQWCRSGRRLPAALSWFLLAAGLSYLFGPVPRIPYSSLFSEFVTTCAASVVIMAAISLEMRVRSYIPNGLLFLGATSYSLYLVHPILVPAVPTVMHKIGWFAPLLAIATSMVVAVVAASLCYVFVEQPVARMLTNWTRRAQPGAGGRGTASRSEAAGTPEPVAVARQDGEVR